MAEESFLKRSKTRTFDTDEDVEEYLEDLVNNPTLTVPEIKKMCRVDPRVEAACANGAIWDRIFIRQFGTASMEKAKMEGLDHPLKRLLTWRYVEYAKERNFLSLDFHRPHTRYVLEASDDKSDTPRMEVVLYFDTDDKKWSDPFYEADQLMEPLWLLLGVPKDRLMTHVKTRHEGVTYKITRVVDKTDKNMRALVYWALDNRFEVFPRIAQIINVGCHVCGTKTAIGCCEVPYCSVRCQKKDWSEHKIEYH